MAIKLDLTDRKILNQLDLNCRQSDAEIGKKARASKQVVSYRIKRLVEREIITGFCPQINTAKLGYSIQKIYLQFRSLPKEKEEAIWNYLRNHPKVIWIISCSGKFDLIFGIVSKTAEEFDIILTDFMNKFSDFILNREITIFNKATLHHRKWLLKEEKLIYWLLGGEIKEEKIDNADKKILEILNNNARTPIIEIATKIKQTSSSVIYRIKQLQKKGIISAFRAALNRYKLGMNYVKAFIYYQNKTSEKEQELLNYCYDFPHIVGVSQSIGSWDLELEFEVENYDQFHKIMKEMKNKFPLIRSFETVYIYREFGVSFLPKKL